MHTITLKTDNNFFIILNELVAKLGTTRSELIRDAVISYKEILEKEQLKAQIKKASFNVQNESLKITDEFDDVVNDGILNV